MMVVAFELDVLNGQFNTRWPYFSPARKICLEINAHSCAQWHMTII